MRRKRELFKLAMLRVWASVIRVSRICRKKIPWQSRRSDVWMRAGIFWRNGAMFKSLKPAELSGCRRTTQARSFAINLFLAGYFFSVISVLGGTPGTAKLNWPFTAENPVMGSPAIGSDGTIYVTAGGVEQTFNGKIYAIDPITAQIKPGWPVQLFNSQSYEGEPISSPVIAANGTIYVASTDTYPYGYLYNLNPDGTENWRLPIPYAYHDIRDPVGSSVAVALNGTVYVSYDDDYQLFAVDPRGNSGTGAIKWIFNLRSQLPYQYSDYFMESCPTIGPDGGLFLHNILRFSRRVSRCGLRWKSQIGMAS